MEKIFLILVFSAPSLYFFLKGKKRILLLKQLKNSDLKATAEIINITKRQQAFRLFQTVPIYHYRYFQEGEHEGKFEGEQRIINEDFSIGDKLLISIHSANPAISYPTERISFGIRTHYAYYWASAFLLFFAIISTLIP